MSLKYFLLSMTYCLRLWAMVELVEGVAITHCGEGEYLKTRSFRRRRSQRVLCQPCPAGRHKMFKDHSDSYCDKCESGRYQAERGQKDCIGIKCSPGQWGPVEMTIAAVNTCQDCLEGRYSPNMGQESCQSCPGGQYSSVKAASSCLGSQECPAGKWGKKFATSASACQQCPVGTYGDRSGLFECQACPKGKYNLREGQSACQPFPDCPRWNRVERVGYTCVPIYPLDWYRLLVGVSWLTFVVNLLGLFYADRSNAMVPCSPFTTFGVMGLAIWLTVPDPANIQDGMKDWEYGVLMGLFVADLLGWAWSQLKKVRCRTPKEVVADAQGGSQVVKEVSMTSV